MTAGILHRWDDKDGQPALSIDSSGQVYFGDQNEAVLTAEGGLAVWFQNRCAGASVKGTVVTLGTAPSSVVECPSTIPAAMGIIYTSGVPVGQFVQVVLSGVAYVLMEDGMAPTIGYWVGNSDAANGRAQVRATLPDNSGPGIDIHNREIGHCVDTVPAGTNVLARVVLHFN